MDQLKHETIKALRIMKKYIPIFLLLFFIGCSNSDWPPEPLSSNEAATETLKLTNKVNGSSRIFEDPEMTKSHRGMPWGMNFIQGEFNLPYNLFTITEASSIGFTANQFEVTFFDENSTHIRIDDSQGDRLLLLRSQGSISTEAATLGLTDTVPGTKVRFGERIFLLQLDGWYENGKRVHSF